MKSSFKQRNKAHKCSVRSNRDLKLKSKANSKNLLILNKHNKNTVSKTMRKAQAKQLRLERMNNIASVKSAHGGLSGPPILCLMVPLTNSATVNLFLVQKLFKSCDSGAFVTELTHYEELFHISMPRFKKRLEILTGNFNNIIDILDAAKIADHILFICPADASLLLNDLSTQYLLTCMYNQGLPVCDYLTLSSACDVNDILHVLSSKYPVSSKQVRTLYNSSDALKLLHHITETCNTIKHRDISYRAMRAHLLAEQVSYQPLTIDNNCLLSGDTDNTNNMGILQCQGYVRGAALDGLRKICVPDWGDFYVSKIELLKDKHPLRVKQQVNTNCAADESFSSQNGDKELVFRVIFERSIDEIKKLMEDEVHAEDDKTDTELSDVSMEDDDDENASGTDNDDDENASGTDNDDDNDDSMVMECEDDGINKDSDNDSESNIDKDDDDVEIHKSVTFSEQHQESTSDSHGVATLAANIAKFREARMQQLFPDEVEAPCPYLTDEAKREGQHKPPGFVATTAKQRFAKYQGLPYDPEQDIVPVEYQHLHRFPNYKYARNHFVKLASRPVDLHVAPPGLALPGYYVRIFLVNIPNNMGHYFTTLTPHGHRPSLTLFSLLPFEHCLSVLHFNLTPRDVMKSDDFLPIRSKEELIFQAGFRRFAARPIFSELRYRTKYDRFERFFDPVKSVTVASVIAPLMYTPCPVLVFRRCGDDGGKKQLIATGSLVGAEPEKFILKRIVLTGHLYKIHGKTAVVRYMFYTPEDVQFFKKFELRTKGGKRGTILDSIGTHGLMKCRFDKQVKADDVVTMELFKRVFPKQSYHCDGQSISNFNSGNSKFNTTCDELFDSMQLLH